MVPLYMFQIICISAICSGIERRDTQYEFAEFSQN